MKNQPPPGSSWGYQKRPWRSICAWAEAVWYCYRFCLPLTLSAACLVWPTTHISGSFHTCDEPTPFRRPFGRSHVVGIACFLEAVSDDDGIWDDLQVLGQDQDPLPLSGDAKEELLPDQNRHPQWKSSKVAYLGQCFQWGIQTTSQILPSTPILAFADFAPCFSCTDSECKNTRSSWWILNKALLRSCTPPLCFSFDNPGSVHFLFTGSLRAMAIAYAAWLWFCLRLI